MKLTADQKWKRFKRWLRRRFPLPYPCRIIIKKLPKTNEVMPDIAYATFDEEKKRFIIRLSPRRVGSIIEDCFHEWSHCMVWGLNDNEDHGALWSAAVGLIYKEYVDWNYGFQKTENLNE